EEDSTSTKALKGGSEVYLSGGTFQIDSADDAVHSNGTVIVAGGNLNISTGDDGMHADNALVIQDGTIEIQKSYEGLEGASVTISGGTIHVTASDDGINAAGGSDDDTDSRDSFQANDSNEIRFTGGTVVIDASGDGVDSNGNVVQEGGTVLVNGPVNSGNGALDFGGTYQISGGILVAAGSSGMAQAPDEDSQQNSLTVIFTETQAAGTAVNISDAAGNSILTFAPTKQFQTIVVSAPGLKQGSSYTVSTGGENNDMNEDGYAASGTYSGGTQLTKVTLSGASTVISSTGEETTLGGMGGMGGGGRPNRNDGQNAGGSDNGGTPPNLGSGAPADAGGGLNGRTQQSGSASSAS
ncbi:MAG: carbohydrate-binding domain-containing protein, partial [Faecalispora jeddahensis]